MYEPKQNERCIFTKSINASGTAQVLVNFINNNGYLFTYLDSPNENKFISFIDMITHKYIFKAIP